MGPERIINTGAPAPSATDRSVCFGLCVADEQPGEVGCRQEIVGEAEHRPPVRHAGVDDEVAAEEVEEAVGGQPQDDEPKALLEADDGEQAKPAKATVSACRALPEPPMTAKSS